MNVSKNSNTNRSIQVNKDRNKDHNENESIDNSKIVMRMELLIMLDDRDMKTWNQDPGCSVQLITANSMCRMTHLQVSS